MVTVLNKWAFLLLASAAVAVAGCGGSGGGSAGGGAGGGAVANNSFVNLPNTPGLVQMFYLSGQGRAPQPGDLTAVITDIPLRDNNNQIIDDFGTVNVQIGLSTYTTANGNVNVPFSPGDDSRVFPTFDFIVNELQEFTSIGLPPNIITGPNGQVVVNQAFAANFLAEPGRQTILPVFIDDAMIFLDSTNQPVFDAAQFQLVNFDPINNEMLGFFSDYVMFDITNLSTDQKPLLSDGTVANRVYFSGDNIAVSQSGPNGNFEVLTPTSVIGGTFNPPQIQGSTVKPGTYDLVTPDPRDVTGNAKIASLVGIWRDYTDVISNSSTFETIVFPNTAESNLPDLVMFQRNSLGAITNVYFGGMDYGAMTWEAFPIGQVVTGDPSNMISGSITSLLDTAGNPISVVDSTIAEESIRSGTFSLDGAAPAGFNVPANGRFIVFRAPTVGVVPASRTRTAVKSGVTKTTPKATRAFKVIPPSYWLLPSKIRHH